MFVPALPLRDGRLFASRMERARSAQEEPFVPAGELCPKG